MLRVVDTCLNVNPADCGSSCEIMRKFPLDVEDLAPAPGPVTACLVCKRVVPMSSSGVFDPNLPEIPGKLEYCHSYRHRIRP